MQIKLVGGASKKIQFLAITESDLDLTLLEYLRNQKITVASSCDGAMVCKKCVIQNDILTCAVTIREFLKSHPDGEVKISYL